MNGVLDMKWPSRDTYPSTHGGYYEALGETTVGEERILDKLDSLDGKTTSVLVEIAKLQEQIKDVPDLKQRINALEKWRWTAMGAIAASGGSLAISVLNALKGAN